MFLVITAGVLASGLGAVALVIWRRARRLSLAVQRSESEELEAPAGAPILHRIPAWHLCSYVKVGPSRLALASLEENIEGTLSFSEADLTLHSVASEDGPGGELRVHIPLARVIEPVFLPNFEEIYPEKEAQILRIEWLRGGERVFSVFGLECRRHIADGLRRDIQVNAGNALLSASYAVITAKESAETQTSQD